MKIHWSAARLAPVVAGVALTVAVVQMLYVVMVKSITTDEFVLIPSAYYHLAARTPELVNEHPPLVKLVAGLPLLLVQPDEIRPEQAKEPLSTPAGKWAYYASFWENNPALFPLLSLWPRVAVIALTMTLGVLTFRFARTMFGSRAAMVAVSFFAIEPTILAHGRVVQTDVPAALGYLLFIAALYRFCASPARLRAIALGGATAAAVLAKYSMLLTLPMLTVVLGWLTWRRRRDSAAVRQLLVDALLVIVTIVLVIHAAYLFTFRTLTPPEEEWVRGAFPLSPDRTWRTMTTLAAWLPADFVYGIFFQIWHNRIGHPAGFLGEYSMHGWWSYFPVAVALKTPLPLLILFVSACGYGIWQSIRGDRRVLWLLVPVAVYVVFLMFSRINIGVRYAIPAFPLLFILVGWLIDRIWDRGRYRAAALAVVGALGCWGVVEAVRAFPDHMTYMNQAAVGPDWAYLSDSNVEWGDDQPALAEYLRNRGEHAIRGAFLGGSFALHHYNVDYVDMLLAPDVKTRYIAVGASYLNGSTVPGVPRPDGSMPTEVERVNTFARFRDRIPEAVFGGSIYLFRDDAVTDRNEPRDSVRGTR